MKTTWIGIVTVEGYPQYCAAKATELEAKKFVTECLYQEMGVECRKRFAAENLLTHDIAEKYRIITDYVASNHSSADLCYAVLASTVSEVEQPQDAYYVMTGNYEFVRVDEMTYEQTAVDGCNGSYINNRIHVCKHPDGAERVNMEIENVDPETIKSFFDGEII